MKIKRLKLENFMAFEKIDINFTNNINNSEQDIELDIVKKTKDGKAVIPYITSILGRNSIGKSSIISGIQLFARNFSNYFEEEAKRWIFNQKIRMKFRKRRNEKADNILKTKLTSDNNKLNDDDKEFEIENIISNLQKDIFTKYSRKKSKDMKIEIIFDDKKSSSIKIKYLPISSNIIIYEPQISIKENYFGDIKFDVKEIKEWSNNLLIFNFNEKKKSYNSFNNNNFYFMLDDFVDEMFISKRKEELHDLIKLANPNFLGFISDEGVLRYTEKGIDKPLSINSLSNGTMRFIELMWFVLKFAKAKKGILLIDEIELFLHNELVNVIKIALMNITAKYDLQVIFTTHNPLILNNYFSNKQIISLEDSDKGNVLSSTASSKMKPRNSVVNKYINGEIAMYPSPEKAKEMSWRIFKKW